jgi:cysteine desulfurase
MPEPAIYIDHNATTRPDPRVIAAMEVAWAEAFGNPGSRHSAGRRARRALEDSRESVATILGANPSEVIFTSGGTEANNTAVFGFTQGQPASMALPAGEHPSIEQAVLRRMSSGWKRVTLELDSRGQINSRTLSALDWSQLRLVTLLLAHNETGVIQPIGELAALCTQHQVPLHLDGVQAVGKIDVDFHALGATTLSLGAHKFHGPRGVGALLIREGTRLGPLLVGGHQEREHRAGTEPVALAVGLATALELWHADRIRIRDHVTQLRDRLEARIIEACSPVVVHGAGAERLPNTLNVAFPGCDGEALLVALDLEGVCCSMGSACASGSSEPAPILLAMGCPREIALASLRFSVGRENTVEEMDEAARRIVQLVERMRGRRSSSLKS